MLGDKRVAVSFLGALSRLRIAHRALEPSGWVLVAVMATPVFWACGDSSSGGGQDASPPDRAVSPVGECGVQDVWPLWDARAQDTGAQDGALERDAGTTQDAASRDGGQIGDGGSDGGRACSAVGGTCTDVIWDICPAGTEPFGNDDPLDCGGHCCLAAPSTSCNSSPTTNCVAGRCQGCWGRASGRCEAGRSCCAWICD